MASPKISVTIEGKTHTLYFGMLAVELFSVKSMREVQQLAIENSETPVDKLIASDIRSFTYIIHGGLCNQAEIEERQRPTFEESYEIAEDILMLEDKQIQIDIFKCFNESRAYKTIIERLLGPQKKSEPGAEKLSELTG